MSGGVVCYIERTPGGSGIRRIRLIAAGLARHWTAPDERTVSSVAGAADGVAHSPVAVARAGATWIAETLNQVGLKRLAAICVDAEGSICAWLSAPSPEPAVVRATITQSGIDGDSSGAGVGAARLLAESTPGGVMGGGLMGDTSLQALATLDPEPASKPGLALPFKKKPQAALIPRKQRYAVLAVQDAIARVLLDELDARGIETDRVVTLWHAMAGAWDRSDAALNDRLVASSTGGAVLLVEPTGRLIWAWTRAGELVAGGSMRLATRARNAAPAQPRSEALAAPDAARRTTEHDDTDNVAIDFTPADAGRLAVDWLSWSAQLGHCPDRVVCLAVPSLGGGANDSTGPESLFANLTRVWPGATIDGAVHEDPIGATIARLAGLGPEVRVSMAGDKVELAAAAAERPYHERPREAMAELSARPGRADRRLYQWIGIALCGAAFLVAAIGFQFQASTGTATAALEAAKKARTDALNAAAVYGAGIPKARAPLDELQAALKKLQDQNKALKPPRPVLRETIRLLSSLNDVEIITRPPSAPAAPDASAGAAPTAAAGDDGNAPGTDAAEAEAARNARIALGVPEPIPGTPIAPGSIVNPAAPAAPANKVVLNELQVGPFAATAKFMVPDADTGPTILEKVQARPGVLQWTGSTGQSIGAGRVYILTGLWPEDNRMTTPAEPAAAPANAAPPKPAPGAVSPPANPTPPAPTNANPANGAAIKPNPANSNLPGNIGASTPGKP